MGYILAVDYGRKRCGLAVSDPGGVIALGLDTVSTSDLLDELRRLIADRPVDRLVIGYPRDNMNKPSDAAPWVEQFIRELQRKLPHLVIDTFDERFTSKMAVQAMIEGGVKKMTRRNKSLIDKTSAVIMLQNYLDRMNNEKKRHDLPH